MSEASKFICLKSDDFQGKKRPTQNTSQSNIHVVLDTPSHDSYTYPLGKALVLPLQQGLRETLCTQCLAVCKCLSNQLSFSTLCLHSGEPYLLEISVFPLLNMWTYISSSQETITAESCSSQVCKNDVCAQCFCVCLCSCIFDRSSPNQFLGKGYWFQPLACHTL